MTNAEKVVFDEVFDKNTKTIELENGADYLLTFKGVPVGRLGVWSISEYTPNMVSYFLWDGKETDKAIDENPVHVDLNEYKEAMELGLNINDPNTPANKKRRAEKEELTAWMNSWDLLSIQEKQKIAEEFMSIPTGGIDNVIPYIEDEVRAKYKLNTVLNRELKDLHESFIRFYLSRISGLNIWSKRFAGI